MARNLKISQSTVSRSPMKQEKYDTVKHMRGNGRHVKVGSDVTKVIPREINENPKIFLIKIASSVKDEAGTEVSHVTIKRWLNKHNLFAYNQIPKPHLTEKKIVARFEASKKIFLVSES